MTENTKMLLKPFKKMYTEHREKFAAASKASAVDHELPEVRRHPAVPSPGCLILLKNYKLLNSSFEMSLWSCRFPVFAPSLARYSNSIFLNSAECTWPQTWPISSALQLPSAIRPLPQQPKLFSSLLLSPPF